MYEDRVRRGAALLDRVRPGWAAEIDTEDLNIQFCDQCVLGQVYGHYLTGCYTLFGSSHADGRATRHGFYLTWEATDRPAGYAHLADLWRAEIRNRLEPADDTNTAEVWTEATEGVLSYV